MAPKPKGILVTLPLATEPDAKPAALASDNSPQQNISIQNQDHSFIVSNGSSSVAVTHSESHGTNGNSNVEPRPADSTRVQSEKRTKGGSIKEKRIKIDDETAEDDKDEDLSSTAELEVCEKCQREGEVLECDYDGCEMVWHVHCVKELKGRIPEGRWICPGPHDEKCDVCGGEGEVIVCEVKNCGRMYHLKCLPQLKGIIPKGFWECPNCIAEREEHLKCAVCLRKREEGNSLVKCLHCLEAVHLGCLGVYSVGPVTCAQCNFDATMASATKKHKDVLNVKVTLAEDLHPIDRARVFQILRGEATCLLTSQMEEILDATIQTRASIE